MRKLICTLAIALMAGTAAFADEGMWMLPLLQKLNAGAMKDLGCKLSPEQIYSVNHSSLKDAVVIFGGGCTGEMISDKGLLVTNHHCGYSSIQKLSSDEHNYLEDGFWAMNSDEEIPVPGLSVTFLVSMSDVTEAVSATDDSVRESVIEGLKKAAEEANPNCKAMVESFYNDNAYYLIVYKIYRDVRFVGAPPASIGKFGGETDNWMWPRHTGDFSMFRVYAGKDNEPAEYSEDNKPYVPKQSLKISLKGINEGDFTMIMGYPGSTQRYQTEAQLQQMMDSHDISIAARTVRQDIMWKWMEKDPSIRLKYADKYANSANGWKKWIGEKKAFADLDIIGKEHEKEAEFQKWIEKKSDRKALYGTSVQDIADGVKANAQNENDLRLLGETVLNIELCTFNLIFDNVCSRFLDKGVDTVAAIDKALEAVKSRYEDYCEPLDHEMAAALLKHYRDNARKEMYLDGIGDFENMDFKAYVDELFEKSVFASSENLDKAEGMTMEELKNDPAMVLWNAIMQKRSILSPDVVATSDQLARGTKAYAAGLLEWNKGKASYPDANSTMRLTYGNVKSYSPKDGVLYKHYTTLKGVMEKEDPDNYEFRVPAKLKELYEAKDYGQYANRDGELPTCFLSNCDITGGNSGSPVLNADGDLVGLAFDGNWESMSGDVIFEPDLQRCISVDIRYVMFVVDKFGGAGHLIKEMELVK